MHYFVADGMFGRFTRWLRMLGCDVTYSNSASDDWLLAIAEKERRVLLTRDLKLFRRAKARGVDAFFVEETNTSEKIAAVAKRYQIRLDFDTSISRCPTCGSVIRTVEKSEVSDKVPKGTFEHYTEFWICVGCSKVYWQGSHWTSIREIVGKAKKLAMEHSDS
jgi:hypothetical protein